MRVTKRELFDEWVPLAIGPGLLVAGMVYLFVAGALRATGVLPPKPTFDELLAGCSAGLVSACDAADSRIDVEEDALLQSHRDDRGPRLTSDEIADARAQVAAARAAGEEER